MIIDIDGGKIHYETSEDILTTKKPILFVLPGGPGGDHSIYKAHSIELEESFCIVYHDPRGCGNSSDFDLSSATMENYINDIESLREHLGLNKISILGTSYGSMCAIGYAIQYQENLDNLILVGGSPSFRFLETAKINLNKRGTPEQKKICEYLWKGKFKDDAHVRDFMRIMRPLYSVTTPSSNTPTKAPTFSYEVLNLGFGDFLQKFDFESDLSKITCKTLIMVGESDWINDPVHLKNFAGKTHSTQLNILENCGHFVAIDRHKEYLKLIKEFIFSDDSIKTNT
ncbi:MAG: alpha/beta hydrolase [Gammaproteobacteria bacterium]